MKSIALAAALSLAASTAFAGSLTEPVVEAPVEPAADGSSASSGNGSSGNALIPILLLVGIGVAVAASSD